MNLIKKKISKNAITYAFIDAQNLNLGVRSQGWKLDCESYEQKKTGIGGRSKP